MFWELDLVQGPGCVRVVAVRRLGEPALPWPAVPEAIRQALGLRPALGGPVLAPELVTRLEEVTVHPGIHSYVKRWPICTVRVELPET